MLSVLIIFLSFVQGATKTITVSIDSGSIQGTINPTNTVASYRGIPYAAPPVDSLRFQNPTHVQPWNTTLLTTVDGPGCPQQCKLPPVACPPKTSEDCLFLNVFAPVTSTADKLPVMFWLHGGDYYQGYGGGLLYDGSDLVARENVIVVSINYRIGALGFLYSGSDSKTQFTGNYGTLDQQFALQWVQRNAHVFGGDPNQVTIFGQSAGSESVAVLLNMPSNKGLFSKAIMQSFPSALPFRTADKAPSFTKVVAKDAGCDVTVPYEECMRTLTWQEILAAAVKAETNVLANLNEFLSLFQPYSPTVGTLDLTKQPMEGFLDGSSIDVPIIMGSVRQEGVIFMYEAFHKGLERTEEDVLLAAIFGLANVPAVLKQYPRNHTGGIQGKDMRNHTAPIITDSLFKCPIRKVALALSEMKKNGTRKNSVWNYHFDHILSFGNTFWLPGSPICVDSVCHGDELPILFHPNLTTIHGTYTSKEQILTEEMQGYWSRFAKVGNPGTSTVGSLTEWKEIETGTESAMKFSTTNEGLINHQYTEMCQLWDDLGYKWILGKD